jgi:adenylosuccinate lyase
MDPLGDGAKIDEMNGDQRGVRLCACFAVCGQTYPRKVDSRILKLPLRHCPELLPHGNDIRLLSTTGRWKSP